MILGLALGTHPFIPPARDILLRAVILVGLVAPWGWLVAIDRLLNRKR